MAFGAAGLACARKMFVLTITVKSGRAEARCELVDRRWQLRHSTSFGNLA